MGQEYVVTNLKVVLSARRLAHLAGGVELAAQIPLLLFDTLIVETKAAFDEVVERIKKAAHHPFSQGCVETL
ncbi:hypothetical protein ALQ37_101687 [Pseudomonas syringae pv. aptata]|uniref:Uncharacterized protein n=1 Tax=Pseudomonas syringae pv. aptata TaxID=83167 RepID=A0A0Q0BYP6_PSEAP|nr:hypothetical protein ALO85_101123 [Pseudomonas syringae pv. aptata]RMN73227.1 hypothetical protein ALQ54_101038 [Pseudomonas syringae]RMO47656.1 hypothetical protein ALQ40_101110 [Pseudomonas syringae]RMO65959.1 hypothetical protein ALQ37_101687 [Pseudomonas syringae pv. aptata]